MKSLALSALLLAATAPEVRFEPEGVRVSGALVQGRILELRTSGAATLLASGVSVEPLATALDVEIAGERRFTVEPGLRVERVEGVYRFTTHGLRTIRFATEKGMVALAGPVAVETTAEGWSVGGTVLEGLALRAGLQNQDDTDANLERMKKSAEKLKSPGGVPKLSTRIVRLFHGDPLTGTEAVNSISVRQIPQVSPSGAP